jgi:hypothetical protein
MFAIRKRPFRDLLLNTVFNDRSIISSKIKIFKNNLKKLGDFDLKILSILFGQFTKVIG